MAKGKHSIVDFAQLKKEFLNDIMTTVEMEDVPGELILNWDQFGISTVPSSAWTVDREGSKWVEVAGKVADYSCLLWVMSCLSKSSIKGRLHTVVLASSFQ